MRLTSRESMNTAVAYATALVSPSIAPSATSPVRASGRHGSSTSTSPESASSAAGIARGLLVPSTYGAKNATSTGASECVSTATATLVVLIAEKNVTMLIALSAE